MMLWLTTAALAAWPDTEYARERLSVWTREISDVADKPFLELPGVEVVPEAELRRRRQHWYTQALGQEEGLALEAATSLESVALYSARDGTIYLLSDHLGQFLAQPWLPIEQMEPLIDCILIHEATHALQFQYIHYDERVLSTRDHPLPQLALMEGQADTIARSLCEPTAFGALMLLRGEAWGWIPELSEVSPYYYGRRYMEVVIGDRGQEAGWIALSYAPEKMAPIIGALPDTPVRLRDTTMALLSALIAPLQGTPVLARAVHLMNSRTTSAAMASLGDPGLLAAPELHQAFGHEVITETGTIELAVLRFPLVLQAGSLFEQIPGQAGADGVIAHESGWWWRQHGEALVAVRVSAEGISEDVVRGVLGMNPRLLSSLR